MTFDYDVPVIALHKLNTSNAKGIFLPVSLKNLNHNLFVFDRETWSVNRSGICRTKVFIFLKESKTKAKAQQLFYTTDLDLPDIDTPIPDLNDLDLDKNRARLEEITLREENDFLNVDDLDLNGDQAWLI